MYKEFVNTFESIFYSFALPNVGTSKQRLYTPYQIDIRGFNSITVINNGASDLFIQNYGFKLTSVNTYKYIGQENEIINDQALTIITVFDSTNVYGVGIIKKKYI